MAPQQVQGGAQQMSPTQLNALQRKAVLSQSTRMKQQIYSGTFNPANLGGQPLNVNVRPVGLITKFIVEVVCAYPELGSGAVTVTDFGALNALSNISFWDLQNNQRHNSFGFHFGLLSSFKERLPFVGAQSYAQKQGSFGANWSLVSATVPTTSAAGSSRSVYEIPIAYSDDDLRGAIYANVVSNQMNLQLTVNPNAVVASGDDTYAVFYGAAGSMSSVTINVYQEYLDQLPVGAQGIVLPSLDISTIYQVLNTNFNGLAANTDFYVQYTNFRKYLSQIMVYNNSGTVGGREVGADINYWQLVSANFTPIFKEDPLERARIARRILQTDPPPGVYYFPSRMQPINTLTYGNMQLDLNPSAAGAQSYLLCLSEFFGQQNVLSQAGSLPANG
jgi:hypothetical protein